MDPNLGLPLQPPLNFAEFGAPGATGRYTVHSVFLCTLNLEKNKHENRGNKLTHNDVRCKKNDFQVILLWEILLFPLSS